MKKIEFYAGCSIDKAYETLLNEAKTCGEGCFGTFNGKEIRSTETLDEVYTKLTGKTKAEFDQAQKEWKENYDRELAEHEEKIPENTEKYRQEARGLVLDSELEYWDKIVPIRLGDLYRGMELRNTLDICRIMRDESVKYPKRLKMAYKVFMDEGHSCMSANLTASMIKRFCPHGEDVADAVLNFRFE